MINDEISNKMNKTLFNLLINKDKIFKLKSQYISIKGYELMMKDFNIKVGNLIINNSKFNGLIAQIDFTVIDKSNLEESISNTLLSNFKIIDCSLLNYFKQNSFL